MSTRKIRCEVRCADKKKPQNLFRDGLKREVTNHITSSLKTNLVSSLPEEVMKPGHIYTLSKGAHQNVYFFPISSSETFIVAFSLTEQLESMRAASNNQLLVKFAYAIALF